MKFYCKMVQKFLKLGNIEMNCSVSIRHYKAISIYLDDVCQDWDVTQQGFALSSEMLQGIAYSQDGAATVSRLSDTKIAMLDGEPIFNNGHIVQNTDKHRLEIKSVSSVKFVNSRSGCQMFVDETLGRAKLVI